MFVDENRCQFAIEEVEQFRLAEKDIEYKLRFKTEECKLQQALCYLQDLFDITPTTENVYIEDANVGKTIRPNTEVFVEKYSVNSAGDRQVCNITGMCDLPTGEVVIVDAMNEKLKLLDESFSIKFTKSLIPYEPQGVCHIKDMNVVLTMNHQNKGRIQFAVVDSNMFRLAETFETGHITSCIQYHDNCLFVSSDSAIYRYTRNGQPINTFYERKNHEWISGFAFSDVNNRAFITDKRNNKLVVLNKYADRIAEFINADFIRPSDVCVCQDGTVLTCGCNCNVVFQLAQSGKTVLDILKFPSGYDQFSPNTIIFDNKQSKIIIGQTADELVVIKLKKTLLSTCTVQKT